MKKIILFLTVFILLLQLPAQAALGSKGLILEGGRETITLSKGEKEYLNVRDGLTNLPIFKGITFYSDNTMVATVGQHSGIIRANGYGNACVYAVDKSGNAGKINVHVRSSKKVSVFLFLPVAAFIIGIIFLWKRRQKNGIC